LLGGKKVHPRRQNPGYAYVHTTLKKVIILRGPGIIMTSLINLRGGIQEM